MRKKIKRIIIFIVILTLFLVRAPASQAAGASLYLSPASGSYTVDENFYISLKVNSGGEKINAAEGTLTFNPRELSVSSLSKSGSIFSLWTTEPNFSNSAGNVIFGGGTPAGFSGSTGTIFTITFKAKSSASSKVSFLSGSVLAADGQGTNVLASLGGGTYTLQPTTIIPPAEKIPAEAETPAPTPGVPLAPVITSTTHPDADKWYSNNSPELAWELPRDVTALKLLIGTKPAVSPTVLYSPAISKKKLEGLTDGVWYFHIMFKNRSGWGSILHRKIMIDTKPPESFAVKIDNEGDPTNPKPLIKFTTSDTLSGIDHYELQISEQETITFTPDDIKESPYRAPLQLPGKHTVIVKAFDRANNSSLATAEFNVEKIKEPVITDYAPTIKVGEILSIKGSSDYPGAQIRVFVKKEGEEAKSKEVATDMEGNWSFIYEESLSKGTYQAWAQVIDARGAVSDYSEKVTIAASLPPVVQVGKVAVEYLSVIVSLVALIVVLILIILYSWHRVAVWKKGVRRETREADQEVIRAFKILQNKIEKQIALIDQKPRLSPKEKEIRDKLVSALNVSQRSISKEIKDIEKELR